MDKVKNNLLTIILCLNGVQILFPRNFKFIPILLLLAFSLYLINKHKKFNYKFFVFASIPYLLLIIGMIYTENISNGFKKLETGASLILYPLCFSAISKSDLNSNLKNVLKSFCIATLIFSLSILFYFILFKSKSLIYFLHHNNVLIDKYIHSKYQIHAIYFSMNIGISLIFSFFLLIRYKKNNLSIIYNLICILLFVSFLIVFNKRMSILGLVIVSITIGVFSFKKIKKKSLILFLSSSFFILIIIGIVFLPRFKNRNSFKEFFNLSTVVNDYNTSIGKRVFLYKSAFKVFKKEPIIGVGTGDTNESISLELKKISKKTSKNFNSHNQYLSYLVSVGLFGFLIFMFYVFYIYKVTYLSKDFLFLGLFLFLCLNMMSENILEREAGVLVYAFFVNLFLRINLKSF